jgi:hypothetical protein
MSDKNLTLKEWQKFSAGKGYKDAAFAKALTAVDKGAQAPAAAQLQGLEELRSQAWALLKVHKVDKALNAWLDDLELGAKKRMAGLEKAASATSASADADEEEGGGALVDPRRLLQQLTMCRKDPARTVQFAYVEDKGKAPGVLTLSPKASGRKLFALLSEHTGSKLGAFGSARVDGDDLVMQLDKPMGGLVKKLRAPVKDCGFKVRRILLMDADGTLFEQDADVQGEAWSVDAQGAAPTAAGQAASGEAALVARLKALLPRVATVANDGAESKAMRLLASEAGVFMRKGDLARAQELLDKAEALMAKLDGAASPAGTAAPVAAPAGLSPKVLYTQTRLAWDGVRKHVQAELRKVETAVLAESTGEPDFTVIQGNVKMLYTVLDRLDDRLIDVLDDALNAETEAQRKVHQKQAIGLVDEYLAYVNSGDPFLEAIDDNGFVDIQLLSVLGHRLVDMRAQLSASVAA